MTFTLEQYKVFSQKLKNFYNTPMAGLHKLDVINIWINFNQMEDKVVTVKQYSNGKFGQPTSYSTDDIQRMLDNPEY